MKLKDIVILEDAAGGSTGAGGVSAFAGRLFVGTRPIKRWTPDDDVPVIQYTKKSAKKEKK